MPDRLRALIYRPGSLGDTLVSLPAIAEIHRRYPEHRLSLLTESHVAGSTRVSPWTILRETGWFDDVYFYSVRPSSAAERWRNATLAMRLRSHGYHDIFSLAPPRTTRQLRVDACIFRGVVGARRYHSACRAAWPPADVDAAHVEHEALRLLRIVDPTASGDSLRTFRLAVPEVDRARGRGLLQELGVRPDQMLVGVGPGSGRSATAWPAERFAAVGSALLGQFRDIVLLAIGGSSERTLCDQLCAAWGPQCAGAVGAARSASRRAREPARVRRLHAR
jgi:ADP-heptose:LPS heptosyltransferase